MDRDFCPTTPSCAYFDPQQETWILSRYADVRAALRERALFLSSPRGETFPDGEDGSKRSHQFAQVKTEIAQVHAGQWRAEMKAQAKAILHKAAGSEPLDLMSEFAHPWSVALLTKFSQAPSFLAGQIADIAACLLYKKTFDLDLESDAIPHRLRLYRNSLSQRADVEARLDFLLLQKGVSMSRAMFMAVAQTLPALLAKSWLALMRNPEQMDRLAAEPALLPNAITELLRYAGIVHTLHRKAVEPVEIGSIRIEKDARVQLKIASANFDPEKFANPSNLDIMRPAHSPLSLGGGLHACVGAVLVREAFAATMPVLLAARPVPVETGRIVWMGDSMLRWPLAVWAHTQIPPTAAPETRWATDESLIA